MQQYWRLRPLTFPPTTLLSSISVMYAIISKILKLKNVAVTEKIGSHFPLQITPLLLVLAGDINLVADCGHRLPDQQQQLTGYVSSHVLTISLASRASLLPVCGYGTIYRLSFNRTLATDNSGDNWKHFCSRLTEHSDCDRAYLRLKMLL